MTITDPFEHDDAAYVLDALSEPERETVEAHLATCTACTTRVNTLAATSTLLADITPDDLAGPYPQPDILLPAPRGAVNAGSSADSAAWPPRA